MAKENYNSKKSFLFRRIKGKQRVRIEDATKSSVPFYREAVVEKNQQQYRVHSTQ